MPWEKFRLALREKLFLQLRECVSPGAGWAGKWFGLGLSFVQVALRGGGSWRAADPRSGFPCVSGPCMERLEAALLEPGSRLLSGRALGDGLRPSVWEPGLPGPFARAPRLFGGLGDRRGHVQGEGALEPPRGLERKGGEAGIGCRLALLSRQERTQAQRREQGPGRQVVPGASREAFFLQASPRRWSAQGQERALGGSTGGVTCL